MKHIDYECDGPVALITINRPPLNLLTEDTWEETAEALARAGEDEAVRVVALTGAGERAFSAGADVKALPQQTGPMDSLAATQKLRDHLSLLESYPKPTIAAVDGYALGGGCQIAIACTFRIASDRAQFGIPEVNLGIVPALGACQRLVRLIGLSWATELVVTGRRVDAQEAYRIGLVNRVVPPAQLRSVVQEFGEMLAQKGPAVLSLTLAALRVNQESSAQAANLLDSVLFALSSNTEESKKARQSIREKSG
ncbi:MAG: enoyl-CoA hydratase/isomerase family protein [Chloroflexi bacterium]|nr:enoyl-CoA hydratase/isomerase family protein [Chloroflexota bacterium]